MQVARFMTRHPTTVEPNAPLDVAYTVMQEKGFRHLPVAVGDEVAGIISDRDLALATGGLPEELRGEAGDNPAPTTVRQIMHTPVVCVEEHEPGARAAKLMVEQRIGALPVLDEGRLRGIVTETNLVKVFRDLCRDPAVADDLDGAVEHLMKSPVIMLAPEDDFTIAIDRFRDWRIRHVPVMQGDELVGMVSDRDVRMAMGRALIMDAQDQHAGMLAVYNESIARIMTPTVVTIEPQARLSEAVYLMLEHRISALPVGVDGEIFGIVTRTDILEHYASVA